LHYILLIALLASELGRRRKPRQPANATITAQRLTPEDRAQRGISDGLLRLSVGLEDAGNLIADLEQALDSLGN